MQEMARKILKAGKAAVFGGGVSARAAGRLLGKISIPCEYYFENSDGSGKIFDEAAVKSCGFVVYSPAFRPDHKWLALARANGALTLCEPDFASLFWNGKIVSVSGTNGKTTLVSFLARAFEACGFESFAAGNIGIPLSDFCADFYGRDNSEKIAVCEVSSFQSAALSCMRSDAFAWTNFAPDHLDWHLSLGEYFNAKFNIARLLKAPVFVAAESVFDYAKKNGIVLPDFAKLAPRIPVQLCPKPFNTPVQAENFSIAHALWKLMSLDENALFKAAEGFELAKYRFRAGEDFDGVEFINDSKATNVHAASAAIEALNGRNIVWIGGGKDKNCSLADFAALLCDRAKEIFLIGQSAQKLKDAVLAAGSGKIAPHICASLGEAVKEAYAAAKKLGPNDAGKPVVLFSPAFSSFGMFSGYAERGKVFGDAVFDLKNLKKHQL